MSMYNGATTKTYVAAMNSMEKSTPSMVTDPTTNMTTIIKALNRGDDLLDAPHLERGPFAGLRRLIRRMFHIDLSFPCVLHVLVHLMFRHRTRRIESEALLLAGQPPTGRLLALAPKRPIPAGHLHQIAVGSLLGDAPLL